MATFVIILFWWWFATKSAKEEVAFTWPFRNLSTKEMFFDQVKPSLQKVYHREGAAYVAGHAIAYGLFLAVFNMARNGGLVVGWEEVVVMIIGTLVCLFTYWWRFDISYARGIGKDSYYLGDTADLDQWVKRWFGTKKPGRNKARFCMIMLLVLIAGYMITTGSYL